MHFDQYFWLEITNTYTTKQLIILFINPEFCTFCVQFLCAMTSYQCTKLTDLTFLVKD